MEQEATEGLNILRCIIASFLENAILIQYFAYFNALLLFKESDRSYIGIIVENITQFDLQTNMISSLASAIGFKYQKHMGEMRESR